jgi:cysteine desulfurase/selenocysteine lyase
MTGRADAPDWSERFTPAGGYIFDDGQAFSTDRSDEHGRRTKGTEADGPLNPVALVADFPILAPRPGRPRLVYLDSAATSQKPAVVLEALDRYYREYNANVHRAIYAIGERATAEYEGARAKVGRLINAPDPAEVIWTRNATESINLVAYAWGRAHIGAGDLIVLTEMEHHANLVPWQVLAQERGAILEFVPVSDTGRLRPEAYAALLARGPKLVAFTHVSNMLGTVNPVAQMTAAAHAVGALVLVDGAQAVPHLPVDVQALNVDFYAFSGHKALGPTGSGVLWGRRALLEAMPPFLTGGDMIRSVSLRQAEYNEIPWKFEAGTPDIAAVIGLGVAADYLWTLGMDRVAAHEQGLLTYAFDALPRLVPGIVIYGPPPAERSGVISFNLPGVHPHDVAQILDRSGICIRAGHHCTMPLHERLGLAASARASLSVFTTHADLGALAVGLRNVERIFGLPSGQE